jgi:hypothetical protein
LKNLGWIVLVALASLFPIGAHSQSVPIIPNYTVFGGFTTAVGGGADIKITGPVWLRAVQVEHLHANSDFAGDHATQLRISAGIAFRF